VAPQVGLITVGGGSAFAVQLAIVAAASAGPEH